MVQFTTEQRTFVVTTFHQTRSLQRTRYAFGERFTEQEPAAAKTIWANTKSMALASTATRGILAGAALGDQKRTIQQ